MPDTARICCPMCGWWRTVQYGTDQRTGKPREIRFDKVDPDAAPMYRVERMIGAGRASKNATIELLESKGLKDLSEDMREQIAAQCHRILEALEKESDETEGNH